MPLIPQLPARSPSWAPLLRREITATRRTDPLQETGWEALGALPVPLCIRDWDNELQRLDQYPRLQLQTSRNRPVPVWEHHSHYQLDLHRPVDRCHPLPQGKRLRMNCGKIIDDKQHSSLRRTAAMEARGIHRDKASGIKSTIITVLSHYIGHPWFGFRARRNMTAKRLYLPSVTVC